MLETPYRIEPCRIEHVPGPLADLLVDLRDAATRLERSLDARTASSLADLVRVTNTYYSNLIEGHNTLPRDIERAMLSLADGSEEQRDRLFEAKAHMSIQKAIDDAFCTAATTINPTSSEFLKRLHREFFTGASDRVLVIAHDGISHTIKPGEFRTDGQEVSVGQHHPPSGSTVAGFMDAFADRFNMSNLGPAAKILAIPAAHHRFNYIHPFLDGNGRVSRLMSHAMAHAAGIGAYGLWSISRGLARGLNNQQDYKAMMSMADQERRGDLDGRGNLSLAGLIEFSEWFLKVCLDQVRFMTDLFQRDRLQARLYTLVTSSFGLGNEACAIVDEVLRRGSLARGDVAAVTRRPERTARDILRRLTDTGLLVSDTPKGEVYLRFESKTADVLFPRLFPHEVLTASS